MKWYLVAGLLIACCVVVYCNYGKPSPGSSRTSKRSSMSENVRTITDQGLPGTRSKRAKQPTAGQAEEPPPPDFLVNPYVDSPDSSDHASQRLATLYRRQQSSSWHWSAIAGLGFAAGVLATLLAGRALKRPERRQSLPCSRLVPPRAGQLAIASAKPLSSNPD